MGIKLLQQLGGDEWVLYCEDCGEHIAGASDRDMLESEVVAEAVARHRRLWCDHMVVTAKQFREPRR